MRVAVSHRGRGTEDIAYTEKTEIIRIEVTERIRKL